jgi:GrpB-like predicted nucleotidyltransferase (UPF0157 family)
MKVTVVMADHDPNWPIIFEEEKTRIVGVIGPRIVGTEHVGTTAVPGLGAKPIIDIMAAASRLSRVLFLPFLY